MVLAGRTPEEKGLILTKVFNFLAVAMQESVRVRDHSEASSVTEAYSLVMPFMTQEMISKLPDMMLAVLALVRNLSKSVEQIYSEKEMDDDLNEEMMGEIEDV